jgi:hypothetical protein
MPSLWNSLKAGASVTELVLYELFQFQEVNHANRILSDVHKREVYDQYGSLGLYMCDQVGEENFGLYSRLASPWFKVEYMQFTVGPSFVIFRK